MTGTVRAWATCPYNDRGDCKHPERKVGSICLTICATLGCHFAVAHYAGVDAAKGEAIILTIRALKGGK